MGVVPPKIQNPTKAQLHQWIVEVHPTFFAGPSNELLATTTDRCERDGCSKAPSFNSEEIKGRRFCALHKLEGMVEKSTKMCEQTGCLRWPTFNSEGELQKCRFCVQQKEGAGIVKSKSNTARCEHTGCSKGCSKGPVFNFEGE